MMLMNECLKFVSEKCALFSVAPAEKHSEPKKKKKHPPMSAISYSVSNQNAR